MVKRTTKQLGEQSRIANGEKQATNTVPKDHLPIMPKGKIKLSVLLSCVFTALFIVIILGTSYLTFPHWKPYVSKYLPESLFIEKPDPRLVALVHRLDQLEGSTQKQIDLANKITALNIERQKYRQSITDLLKRIDGIEKSISTVKEKASSAANSAEVAKAHEALKALNNRLVKLESSSFTDGNIDPNLKSRLEKLEKDKNFSQNLTERVSKLEDFGLQSNAKLNNALAQIGTSENSITSLNDRVSAMEKRAGMSEASKASLKIIQAVVSLHSAIQRGYKFNDELNELKAVAKSDPAIHTILMVLEKHSEKGIRTLSGLRDNFNKIAGSIVAADFAKPDADWKDKALKQISTIIKFRRIDDKGGDLSTEGIVAQSEKYLSIGDLDSAVRSIEKLNGPAQFLVAPWLASAKARLAADQVLSSLHNHALSLLAATEG